MTRGFAVRLPALAAILSAMALAVCLNAPASAQSKPIVSGAGSTWSQVAVDQWRADVSRFGLRINYQGVGSSAGRQFYIQDQVDFAVSEIPFEAQELDTLHQQGKEWAYLPIVAGGTSVMYNLKDASGQAITTLRLSAETLTGIFTGTIKKWNDPALQADNPGLGLPDLLIVPVVRSDGSGTSAQFTAYMSHQQHDKWCAFEKSQSIDDCGYTSNYPTFPGSVGQSGSDGVANYVHSESTGQGAVTYVEAAYAIQRGRPVAFLKNASGNYTLPTSSNVATALKSATLNSDETQNLDQVYVNSEPSAYAMSSYSYMIVPTKGLDPAKGDVLGQFMAYFACDGQRKADQLGYSPLPANLVEVVFGAIKRVPGASPPPAMSECNNPTIAGGSSGGTSDDTAAALSGGASSSGVAPSSPSASGDGVEPAAFTGGAGGGATGGVGGVGGTSGGTIRGVGGGSAGVGGGVGGVSGVGGAVGGPGGAGPVGGATAGGVGGALPPQALQQITFGSSGPSDLPLTAAGLAVALLVFMPPVLSIFRKQQLPPAR
jgi:phosphate transport system substrate-binding protein